MVDEADDEPVEALEQNPADWMDGSKSIRFAEWRWDLHIFRDVQKWGDKNCCRFILVSEKVNDEYRLILYVAPKPNSYSTGLCHLSVTNRDRGLSRFENWFQGFLDGRGIE